MSVLKITLTACFLALAGAVWAQPEIVNVSGAVPDGGNVTIQGHGFLDKIPAAPLRYDNFENGQPGVRLPGMNEGGWYTVGQSGSYPRYSQERQRLPGETCALQDYSVASNQTIGLQDIDVDTLYVSGWTYRDDYNGTAMYCENVKFWGNFTARVDGVSTFPQSRLDAYWSRDSGHLYCLDEDGQQAGSVGTGARAYLDHWFRLERFMAIGDSGVANGQTWASYDLDRFAELNGQFHSSELTYGYWLIGQYFRKEPYDDPSLPVPHIKVYWSELYVDNTQARVEIGDREQWSQCTHREIQIPTAWSDAQITVTGNWGTLAPETPLWLFVVDKNGSVSEGFSVSLDGSGDPGPPGPIDPPVMSQ